MIGLMMRWLFPIGLETGATSGLCAGMFGCFVAICAVCGIWKCSKCRMRDCGCIKWCMRTTGADKFADFELMVLVHEATYTSQVAKRQVRVRISAISQSVMSDPSTNGIFQQPLALLVEQGTEVVLVELIDARDKKVLASLKLSVEKDIMSVHNQIEQVHLMKQKSKGVLNPRIKLTIHMGADTDMEKGLLPRSNVKNISTETDLMLRQQIYKASKEEEDRHAVSASGSDRELSELELIVKACAGPLDKFGSWGTRESVYIAVRGPPDQKKYVLGLYKDQHSYEKGQPAKSEVDLLRVLSVQPDPGRSEFFIVTYLDRDKAKQRLTFRRIDRARDVWVEMFMILIRLIREQKDEMKKAQLSSDGGR